MMIYKKKSVCVTLNHILFVFEECFYNSFLMTMSSYRYAKTIYFGCTH